MSEQEQMKVVEKLSKDMTIDKETRDALKWILKEVNRIEEDEEEEIPTPPIREDFFFSNSKCECNEPDENTYHCLCDEVEEEPSPKKKVKLVVKKKTDKEKWLSGMELIMRGEEAHLEYDKLVEDCYGLGCNKYINTKDEDLKVGDIVSHSLGCRMYRLVQVVKLTEKSIIYRYCKTMKFEMRDKGGDFHTYGLYCDELTDEKQFRKKKDTKILSSNNSERWRGQFVYDKSKMIWIKEEETDIMR